MFKNLFFPLLLLAISFNTYAYLWASAVPSEVHIVPGGLVLVGEFNNDGVTCASGPKAIFLPNTDTNFEFKLSLALTAKATDKKIRVLIGDPIETSCIQISAMGYVPAVFYYYWQLKD